MYVSRPPTETDEEAQSCLHQSPLVPGWQFSRKVGNCQPVRVVGYFSAQSVENNPTTHEGENQKGKEIHFYPCRMTTAVRSLTNNNCYFN